MEGQQQQYQEGPYATAMIPRQPSTLERPRPPDRRSHSRQTQSHIGSSRPQTVSKVSTLSVLWYQLQHNTTKPRKINILSNELK